MFTHDLRFEDAYHDPDRAQGGDGDLVTVSGWGCGEDIRPGDYILIGDDGPAARYKVVRITSRFARGLFFWTAGCAAAGGPQDLGSVRAPLRLVTR